MITLNSCPNCKNNNFAEHQVLSGGSLITEMMPKVKVSTLIIVRYAKCFSCNLIFQNPRLSDKELDIYYGSGYYRKNINPPPEGMDKGEENRAEIDSKLINQYIGKVGSHLDLGCGLGYFLNKIRARVKVGTESDPNYVKFKDILVYSDIKKIQKESFDLVSALHVLEHVSYPLEFLKKMTKLVKKDGYIVIEVPSAKTRGGPLGFAHLSYFEPDVLKLMCMQVGLKVIYTEFTPHLFLICKLNNK